ncbi:DUF5808 domain-containing protein [Daejeonella sp. H1SJ63]|uniref:DUF5808 domain-containing protein n=1 Tax=Daejeonella sp. H1SJ63 TaxID=3034145 RepID=UPI0023EC6A71|nr:DUF5808 domain-containing protein [Daejeonella sp. H1SJ63]
MNEFDKQNNDLWRFGIIYYNPNDPSVWVEKRVGIGWTLNFAHVRSYFIMGLILAIPLALGLFSSLFS